MANPPQVALSPPGRHSRMTGFFERVPSVAGGAVVILGAFVLLGWALDLGFVTTATRGFPMIPLAALCFVLAGGALILAVQSSAQCHHRSDPADARGAGDDDRRPLPSTSTRVTAGAGSICCCSATS